MERKKILASKKPSGNADRQSVNPEEQQCSGVLNTPMEGMNKSYCEN